MPTAPILNMKKLGQLSGLLTWREAADTAAETEQPFKRWQIGVMFAGWNFTELKNSEKPGGRVKNA